MAIPHTFKAAKEKKRISKNPAGLFQEKCTRPSLWTELRPQELLAGPQPQGECVQRPASSGQRPPKVSRAGVASRPAVGAGRRPHACSRGLRAGWPPQGAGHGEERGLCGPRPRPHLHLRPEASRAQNARLPLGPPARGAARQRMRGLRHCEAGGARTATSSLPLTPADTGRTGQTHIKARGRDPRRLHPASLSIKYVAKTKSI